MSTLNEKTTIHNIMTGGITSLGFGRNSRPQPPPPPPPPPNNRLYPQETYEPSRPWLDCERGDIASNKYTQTINHCKDWAIHDVGGDAFSWNGQTCIAKRKSQVDHGRCRVNNGWQYYEYDAATNTVNPLR